MTARRTRGPRAREIRLPLTIHRARPEAERTIEPIAFEIYCRVVDNLGDAGVCWRLARQLARDHRSPVALWIDAPPALAAIAPQAAPGSTCEGVAIGRWEDARLPARPRCVVVSAFGCELPAQLRQRLAGGSPMLWINLEYLSAKPWIDGCHGLASRKPGDAAIEHFFYPGFTAASGGLLREHGLIEARDAFRARGDPDRWLAQRGFDARPGERRISLFCYPDAPVAALLALLRDASQPTHLMVPAGVAREQLTGFLGSAPLPGRSVLRGALRVECFDLLPQDDYDRLLWSCAMNFVRGEDSWLRALWAGSPFVWQPYRQAQAAHRAKLDAFLARLRGSVATPTPEGADAVSATEALFRAWDDGQGLPAAWRRFESAGACPGKVCAAFAGSLARTPDLATRLVAFCRERLANGL